MTEWNWSIRAFAKQLLQLALHAVCQAALDSKTKIPAVQLRRPSQYLVRNSTQFHISRIVASSGTRDRGTKTFWRAKLGPPALTESCKFFKTFWFYQR